MKLFFEEVYRIGEAIDLAGVHYGPHSRTKRYYEMTGYYPLLAGLARKIGAKKVLDVGTHFGGSAMAMQRGMDADGLAVTIDVTFLNNVILSKIPNIRRVCGSSLDPEKIAEISDILDGGPIDVLYIDTFHDYPNLMANIEAYLPLNPAFIVMDDISINDSMKEAWRDLCARYAAVDVTDLCKRNCGFGVLVLDAGRYQG